MFTVFIILGGLCFIFLLLHNEPHIPQWLWRTTCYYPSQLSGLTRLGWVALPFQMKLVGCSHLVAGLGWNVREGSFPWLDVEMGCLRGPQFSSCGLSHMARLDFPRGVFILTGSGLWVSILRRRKWKLSGLLCSDLKILRTWLLLHSFGQSSHSGVAG